jgi:parallel beta-helix repeat protein
MWTAASTGDRQRLVARVAWITAVVLVVLLPGAAAGDNSDDKKPPKPPADIKLVAASTTTLTFAWSGSPSSSARVGTVGYTIYRDTTVVGTTAEPTYMVENLSCGTTYTFSIDAFDQAGNHSDRVPVQGTTAACVPAPPPPPPSGDTQPPTQPGSPVVGSVGTTSISITWQASSDNVGVAGYALFRNGDQDGTTTPTSYTFTGLSCGTAYTLAVSAFDAARNTSSRAQLSASTAQCAAPLPDTSPPTAPGALTKTAAGATSIAVSWAPSTDNVGVAGYTVFRDATSVGTTTSTNYTVGALQCGTTFTIGVSAFDAAGNRSAKSQVTATTAACAPASPPGNGFYVSPSGSDSNPGTLAAPWRTIGKAAATLSAGQTVYLRAGTYAEGMGTSCTTSYNTVSFSNSGTSGAPITVAGYPGEESSVIVKTKLRLAGSWILLRDFVYDRNYAYSSADLACTGEPLHLLGDDIVITGLEVRNNNMSGIFLGGADRATIEGNWVHDNGTHYNADHGIYWSSGTGGTVANNVFERNYAFGIHMYPNPVGQLITENTVVGSGRAGIILSGAQNQTVVNNISAWNGEEGIRTGALGCTGCRADQNVLFGNSADYYFQTPLSVGSTVHADPGFVNRSAGNYRLAAGSPAVDSAIRQYARADDFDGISRPVGAGPDIGAFERRP